MTSHPRTVRIEDYAPYVGQRRWRGSATYLDLMGSFETVYRYQPGQR